jgi:hypothetical protein
MPAYADWGDWVADWGDDPTNARGKREAVAALIVDALPDSWSVYASPPDVITMPAVVIAPRNPYRETFTWEVEAVHLSVNVIVPRAAGLTALDVIDEAMDVLVRGSEPILDVPSVVEAVISGVTQATNGGAECVVGTIDITVS